MNKIKKNYRKNQTIVMVIFLFLVLLAGMYFVQNKSLYQYQSKAVESLKAVSDYFDVTQEKEIPTDSERIRIRRVKLDCPKNDCAVDSNDPVFLKIKPELLNP